MIFLDLKTIFISNIAISFICTLIFVSLWLDNKNIFRGLSLWVAGMAAQLLGSLLILLRGIIPDFLSIVIANLFIVGGILVFYIGFRAFMEKPGRQIVNYILLAFFGGVIYYFSAITPSLYIRTVALAGIFLFFSLQWVWFSLYTIKGSLRRLTAGIGFVFIVYCLANLARIIVAITGSENIGNDFFASNQFDTWIVFVYSLLIILIAYNLILSVNRRLSVQVAFQEEKFRTAFREAPYAVLFTHFSNGQIVDINKSFSEMMGYSSSEAVGKTTLELGIWLNFDDRKIFVDQLSAGGSISNYNFKYKTKSGKIIIGATWADVIEVGNEQYILSTIIDVTEDTNDKESLKKMNEFLVGREIKMTELKNKIKELEEKNKS